MGRQRNQYVAKGSDVAGVLTGEEFAAQLSAIFGSHGWRAAFERGTGYSRTQIHRYETGRDPIPKRVAIILELLAVIKAFDMPMPEKFSPPVGGYSDVELERQLANPTRKRRRIVSSVVGAAALLVTSQAFCFEHFDFHIFAGAARPEIVMGPPPSEILRVPGPESRGSLPGRNLDGSPAFAQLYDDDFETIQSFKNERRA